jgi:hypothetical protein
MERFELLSRLQDKDPFLLNPIELSEFGTEEKPVQVHSADTMRIVGCTGKSEHLSVHLSTLILFNFQRLPS